MKEFALLIALGLVLLTNANAFDVNLLANNKEAYSRELVQRDVIQGKLWSEQHRLGEDELKVRSRIALSMTFNEMERIDTNCEVGLINQLQADAQIQGVIDSSSEMTIFLVYLRQVDLIDDVLFKMLKDSNTIAGDFQSSQTAREPRKQRNYLTRQNSKMDLNEFFAPLKEWPDDIEECSLDVYYNMTQKISWKTTKDRDLQMAKLHYLGYKKGVIDLPTYHKLESLRSRNVLHWPIYFKRYADIVNNAKDKLTDSPEKNTQNNFTVEYVSRKENLTQRGKLYMTYNSTQIMMLAQILEKTAKRMDSKLVTLNWQYTDDPNGEGEVYIFSPMEQYRAAIKMLRRDMAEVMRSDAFRGTGLTYDHLIAAAYETGFVKSEELDYVLKFEDFWNPKTPKWKTYTNFAFSLAGTASFYLPPPWNIIGAIGLVLTQSKLVNGDQLPDPDDNWNVII